MFGDFLDVALRNGASSGVGIEIDPDAAAVCRAKGFSVFDSLEALRGQPTRFDWIVLQHVLEHVPSDVEYVRELKQFLSPTGRIVICVPNFSCWSRSVFPRSWGWYQVPAHLRHYTPRSLETLLNRHGLVVKQIQTRGADSLMPMSTVMNILNRRVTSGKAVPGPLLQAVVRLNSFLLRYYLYLGSEEIVVEAGVN
jgi:SAM-dependent methyltransferase